MANNSREKEKVGWIFPALIFVFVVGAWLATWYFLIDVEGNGTINALFSGLAFGALFYAILLQRAEKSIL